jgi:NADH-quinone oxidoreductase subunit L
MFVGVGVGAFDAGVFHLVTHAFFKACLFLGAGAVIHALHGEQDIRRMGGLGRHLKWTRLTFLASTAAIAGFPGTAGFFSKDEILWKAYASAAAYGWVPYVVYVLCLAGAVLTAFYMTRLYLLTFEGPSRADPHVLEHLHHPSRAMEVPLQILAALALTAGLVGIPHHSLFEHWLHPVLRSSAHAVGLRHEFSFGTELGFMALSVIALAIGAYTAFLWYLREEGRPAAAWAARYPGLHALLSDKWRVDELYDRIVVRPLTTLARVSFDLFDRVVIDTVMVHGTAAVVRFTGAVVRAVQTGALHTYAFFMVVGLAWTVWAVTTPEAHFTAEVRDGRVQVRASRGPGYEYRWDLDGDRRRNFGPWTSNPQATTPTEIRGAHRVRLQVRSPWGTDDAEQVIR